VRISADFTSSPQTQNPKTLLPEGLFE